MMINKKGQTSASSAALLVAIIAAMILLYTLFLPPDERAKLLEEKSTDKTDVNNVNNILLKETPGRLDLIKTRNIDHKVSSFNLVSKTEGRVIKEFDSIYVQRTVFKDSPQSVQFDISDPKSTDNMILSFVSKTAKGRLIITLNGNVVSDKVIDTANPSPIKLPKSMLKESNTLQFQVSSPGILFFLTNKYSLDNVKIFGDVTDKSGLTNTQSFFITTVEDQNLEKATLAFMPTCRTDNVGKLDITMNNQVIYSGVPDCGMPVKVDVSPGRILEGENNIAFLAESGNYIIDQAKITTYLKDAIYPTYYFTIDQDDIKNLENDTLDINMSVIFVKTDSFQDVEVEINGRKFSIDNKNRIFMEKIDPYLREDNNAITLRPLDGSVDVVELKIFRYYK